MSKGSLETYAQFFFAQSELSHGGSLTTRQTCWLRVAYWAFWTALSLGPNIQLHIALSGKWEFLPRRGVPAHGLYIADICNLSESAALERSNQYKNDVSNGPLLQARSPSFASRTSVILKGVIFQRFQSLKVAVQSGIYLNHERSEQANVFLFN